MVAKGLVPFLLAAFLVGCGESGDAVKVHRLNLAERKEMRAAEARLMADPSTALPEMKRRFAQHVQRQGGVLVVTNRRLPPPELDGVGIRQPFLIAAVPATVPWTVKCSSSGLDVMLGTLISGDISEGSGEVGLELGVSLTNTRLSEQQCFQMVGPIGEEVVNVLSDRHN